MKASFDKLSNSFDYDNNIYGKNWVHYHNGNYRVHINLNDGTKIRENNEDFFKASFPESIDLKITNKCLNNCNFCHENSTCDGEHGDIMSPSFIDKLHPYTEIAIGGGNPLEHPDLIPFLEKLKTLKMIPSMTIRQNDFMDNLDLIASIVDDKLIYGLGISLVSVTDDFIEAVKDFPNAVIHVINGIITPTELYMLANNNLKILILGYKEVRRGLDLYCYSKELQAHIDARKRELRAYLPKILENNWFSVISFDNLALNQLEAKRLIPQDKWNQIYMGDDGIDGEMTSASMYIDMVKKEFARNSCEIFNRKPIENRTVEEMYQTLQIKDN